MPQPSAAAAVRCSAADRPRTPPLGSRAGMPGERSRRRAGSRAVHGPPASTRCRPWCRGCGRPPLPSAGVPVEVCPGARPSSRAGWPVPGVVVPGAVDGQGVGANGCRPGCTVRPRVSPGPVAAGRCSLRGSACCAPAKVGASSRHPCTVVCPGRAPLWVCCGRGVIGQRTGGKPATLRQSFRHRNRLASRLAGLGSVAVCKPGHPLAGGV